MFLIMHVQPRLLLESLAAALKLAGEWIGVGMPIDVFLQMLVLVE